MVKTKVVNFFAGPSAGKSTSALNLAGWMKERRMNVEYVPEFPKDLVWNERVPEMDDQLYLLGEQHHRIYMQSGKLDWIVTDGPILLGLHYCKEYGMSKFKTLDRFEDWIRWYGAFQQMTYFSHNFYNNVNFYVDRGDRQFIQEGRNQDEATSRAIDTSVKDILDDWSIDYFVIKNWREAIDILRLNDGGDGTS